MMSDSHPRAASHRRSETRKKRKSVGVKNSILTSIYRRERIAASRNVDSEDDDMEAEFGDKCNSSRTENYSADERESDGENECGEAEEPEIKRRKLGSKRISPVYVLPVNGGIVEPQLQLPLSADDLLISRDLSLRAVAIHEVLRHFSAVLRLSPFRIEDFCAAIVVVDDNFGGGLRNKPGGCGSNLISAVHVTLLRAVLRDDDLAGITFVSHDARDSVNITLHSGTDTLTWFELTHIYLDSVRASSSSSSEYSDSITRVMPLFHRAGYHEIDVNDRLALLEILVDRFLETASARDMINGVCWWSIHEDKCRFCHRLGDLICCETCPAVYHLWCTDPPLSVVPEDEWLCSVCTKHQVPGVIECVSNLEKVGLLCRQDPLGYDRHGRRYWFIARRIFVESEAGEVWYYSTPTQLDTLIDSLDCSHWEAELVSNLTAAREEIINQMRVTVRLTHAVQGNKSSSLDVHDELLLRLRSEKDTSMDICNEISESPSSRTSNYTTASEENSDKLNSHSYLNNCCDDAEECSSNHIKSNCAPSLSSFLGYCTEEQCISNNHNADTKEHLDESLNIRKVASDNCDSKCIDKNFAAGDYEKAFSNEADILDEHGDKNVLLKGDMKQGNKIESVLQEPNDSDTVFVNVTNKEEQDANETATAERRYTRSSTGAIARTNFYPTTVARPSSARHLVSELSASRSNASADFKLGVEGDWKLYRNLYTSDPLAMTKPRSAEARDHQRHLGNKFNIESMTDKSPVGVTYYSRQVIAALQAELLKLEESIPRPFLHPNWPHHLPRWLKAIEMCTTAIEFGLALMILEACIKPVLFYSIWNDGLGHISFYRTSAAEREERKKSERDWVKMRREEEENWEYTRWIKYSVNIKHQLWKLKGEEYRSTGRCSWVWIRSTRRCHLRTNISSGCQSQVSRRSQTSKQRGVECLHGLLQYRENQHKHELLLKTSLERVLELYTASENLKCAQEQAAKLPPCDRSSISASHGCYSPICQGIQTLKLANAFIVNTSGCVAVEQCDCYSSTCSSKASSHSSVKTETFSLDIAGVSKPADSTDNVNEGIIGNEVRMEKDKETEDIAETREDIIETDSDRTDESGSENEEDKDYLESSDRHSKCAEKEMKLRRNSVKKKLSTDEGDQPYVNEDSSSVSDISDKSHSFSKILDPCKPKIASNPSEFATESCRAADIDNQLVQEGKANESLCRKVNKSNNLTNHQFDCANTDKFLILEDKINVARSLQEFIVNGNVTLNQERAKLLASRLALFDSTQYSTTLLRNLLQMRKKNQLTVPKNAIPIAHNFVSATGSGKNLFVLEKKELRRMARRGCGGGGIRGMAEGFNYTSKTGDVIGWPYPCPRPYFRTAWRYRTQTVQNLAAVALQLRILRACLRLNDLQSSDDGEESGVASRCGTVVKEAEGLMGTGEMRTVDIVRRRDVGPTGLRAEYLVRTTVIPLEQSLQTQLDSERRPTPIRTGLRERRQLGVNNTKLSSPTVTEVWLPEEEIGLLDIKRFSERLERQSRRREAVKKTEQITGALPTRSLDKKSRPGRTVPDDDAINKSKKKTGLSSAEEELQVKKAAMQQRRLGGQLKGGERLGQTDTDEEWTSTSVAPMTLRLKQRTFGNNATRSPKSYLIPMYLKTAAVPKSTPEHTSTSPIVADNASGPRPAQSIRIVRSADGRIKVFGLKAGQKMLQLPDGKLKLVEEQHPTQPTTPLTSAAENPVPDNNSSVETNSMKTTSSAIKSTLEQATIVTSAVQKLFACLSPLKGTDSKPKASPNLASSTNHHIFGDTQSAAEKGRSLVVNGFDHDRIDKSSEIASEKKIYSPCKLNAVSGQRSIGSASNSVDRSISRSSNHQLSEDDEGYDVMPILTKESFTTPSKNPGDRLANQDRSTQKDEKLVCCIACSLQCDPTSIRCQACLNFFHRSCVDVTALSLKEQGSTYTCLVCESQRNDGLLKGSNVQEESLKNGGGDEKKDEDDELHCLCRTPYDESEFYIRCDDCDIWYHGRCVSVSPEDADEMTGYQCPSCVKKTNVSYRKS